jgi:hypothetical protein
VESSDRIITLLEILSEPAQTESSGFALPERVYERQQQKKQEALRELAQLQGNSAIFQMYARINAEMPPGGGSRDEVLRAAQEFATLLLPAFQRARSKEAGLTNREKFLREAANQDPFLENSSLTRDAFATQGEPEPVEPLELDSRGNVKRR